MAMTTRYVTVDSDGGDGSSGNPWTWAEALAGAAAGDLVKVASGTYSQSTATTAFTNSGTITSPIAIVGCDTSWNILAPTRANGTGVLDTTNMPVFTYTTGYMSTYGVDYIVLRNLNVQSASTSRTLRMNSYGAVIDCAMTNSGAAGSVVTPYRGSYVLVYGCDLFKTATSGAGYCYLTDAAYGGRLVGNRFICSDSNTAGGAYIGLASVIVGNVFKVNGIGILLNATSAGPFIYGNHFVGSASDAIQAPDGTTLVQHIFDNQFTDGGAWGVNLYDADEGNIMIRNRFTRNTSGAVNNGGNWYEACGLSNVTTAQDGGTAALQRAAEYIDYDNGDYRLRPGALGKEAGAFKGDIGALQRQSPTLPAVTDVADGVAYGDPSPDNLEGTLVGGEGGGTTGSGFPRRMMRLGG
jgi:hypothetical protein